MADLFRQVVIANLLGVSSGPITDPETGGSYTVKQHTSEKEVGPEGWRHTAIVLKPFNPQFESIKVAFDDPSAPDLRIVAEHLGRVSM